VSQSRERIDKLVVRHLRDAGLATARAEVQRWIAEGRITMDGVVARSASKAKRGMLVEVTPLAPPLSDAVPDASVSVNVVFEDEHLLIVDKQAGLVVHPARGHRTGTLVNGLLALGIFKVGGGPIDARDPEGHLRPGIVHRLDKDTSGLLVVAKDASTREGLKALFASHDIARAYVAIVVGTPVAIRGGRPSETTYDTWHGRHPTHRMRFTSRLQGIEDGGRRLRRAVTHVCVEEALVNASLVRCRLQTGRTHQIRVHLAEQAGTPILGDRLYGKPPEHALLRECAEQLGRQALHASVLGFVHPITGATLRWHSPMPADMAAAHQRLRQP
jgi:23S rRNA pseudouridine1911/1915/1917 synthase